MYTHRLRRVFAGRQHRSTQASACEPALPRRAELLLLVAALALVVLAPRISGAASLEGGSIVGKVVDQQGVALPGVAVTARSIHGAAVRTATSDGEGLYQLAELAPGSGYTVVGELNGFSRFSRSGLELRSGTSVTVDIELRIGGLSESIQVLGEEVSRSRNRIERLQDVPLSVSVITGKELERLQATDVSAITQRAANISWNYGNQRTSSLAIRGIGKQGQTEAQDPSVGFIVDGVNYAYNALTSSYDFTDVDAVEVTRGPQGTLLGKNTSLGVVNVTTRRPGFTSSTDLSLTLGQNDTVLGRVAAGGAVIDNLLAWRGTFSVSKGAGDIQNLYNRDITYTNKDRVSGRVQFLLLPGPSFNLRVAVDAQPRAGETTNGRTFFTPTPTTYANGSVNPLTTDAKTRLGRRWFTEQDGYSYEDDYLYGGGRNAVLNDNQRALVTGSNGASAEANWYVGRYTLTSISAYKDYHFNATNDDSTPFDVYRNSGGFWNDYRQLTQELRLTSQVGRFVDYQAGFFYIDVDNDVDYRREWGNDAGAWFANLTQYARLDTSAAGRYLLQESLDRLSMSFNSPAGVQAITNKSGAFFAQANWHLAGPLVLTTGVRLTHEDRQNSASTLIKDYGNAPELNPVGVNGVALGGFASDSLGLLTTGNSPGQLGLADQVAAKYFGVAPTGLPGSAYNSLSAAQKRQVADAKAIRAAQLGVLFDWRDAEPFKAVQPNIVISPTYKLRDNLTTYASLQHGEKAGIAQFTNGNSNLARAEKTTAYEWGLKSVLLGKTLVLNADVFLMHSTDYQQAVRVFDAYTTQLNNDGLTYYTTATGNVPRVRAKGVEVDGVYAGIPATTIRFSGAYNDARYDDFPNSAQPVENGYAGAAPYRDVSGQPLPGSSLWSFNVGVDVRVPVLVDKEFHASFNTAYNSRYNADNSLSEYAWVPGKSVTDLDVGFGKRGQKFALSLLVKNLFDNRTPITLTWNSYTPAFPRWVGFVFTARL